jgi:hypothetical protein
MTYWGPGTEYPIYNVFQAEHAWKAIHGRHGCSTCLLDCPQGIVHSDRRKADMQPRDCNEWKQYPTPRWIINDMMADQ